MRYDILNTAEAFAGQPLSPEEKQTLMGLCEAAEAEWTARLSENYTPEHCGGAFVPACAWVALAALMGGWEVGEPSLSFSAGDLSIRPAAGERANAARTLREQAESIMRPYVKDDQFCFRGVSG